MMNTRTKLRSALIVATVLSGTISCTTDFTDEYAADAYIAFSPEEVISKGTLLNAFPDGGSFGVLGYCKVKGPDGQTDIGTADWETKKVHALPDIFYNKQVTYKNGETGYESIKPWSGNSNDKYTFFAYYPYNASGIRLSSATIPGVPQLTFTQQFTPASNGLLDKTKMQDVMVAMRQDHQSPQGVVPFTFKHILTAVDFAANNLNKDHQIKITSLKMAGSFTKEFTIAMDNQLVLNRSTEQITGFFQLITTGKEPVISSTIQTGKVNLCNNEEQNFLLLIPQEKPTTWNISVEWDLIGNNGTVHHSKQNLSFGSNIIFRPGRKHTLTLEFLGDACVIGATTGSSWDTPDNENNDIEFE